MLDEPSTWVGATARDIARAVRRGDATATQVVADHLDYIQAQDATLNAFRVVRAAAAITEAEAVDEQEDLANLPLAGVPVAVKENTSVAGLPTWYGSAAARAGVADADHEVVRRLRGAGAVVVGTTRMPELGLWALTDDETAVTRNPWRTDPRAARPAARRLRWPPDWYRSHTATTGSARSAFRPRAAGWSGSSRAAGWCPRTCRSRTGSA